MEIYVEYKKAKVIDFCTIQIEETKEIIEVDSFKDISKSDDGKLYYTKINESRYISLDEESRAELLDDLCK